MLGICTEVDWPSLSAPQPRGEGILRAGLTVRHLKPLKVRMLDRSSVALICPWRELEEDWIKRSIESHMGTLKDYWKITGFSG